MMKVVSVVVVAAVAVGCASGAEMRPRGRRMSVKIDGMEKRLAKLEAEVERLNALLAHSAPAPAMP